MPVLSRSFVAICVAVLAACVSAVLYARLSVPLFEAMLIGGILCVITLLIIETIETNRSLRRVDERIADTRAALQPIVDELVQMRQQMAVLTEALPDPGVQAKDATADDIATLGSMVKELADSIAVLEVRVAGQDVERQRSMAAPESDRHMPQPVPETPPVAKMAVSDAATPSAPAPAARPEPAPQRAKPAPSDITVSEIVEAIGADQVETFLQPIVTLPQRKVRSYEVLARLRTSDGSILTAEDFLPTAEQLGIAPVIDLRQYMRAVQIVRRLLAKSRDITVSLNISPRSLTASAFVTAAIDSARQSPGLSSQIAFELDQAAVRTLGHAELSGIRSLAEAEYRFCMDQVADLRIDGAMLFDRGFRMVKVPASLLLDPLSQRGIEIHAADLGGLLRRQGIELIADRIESEDTVRDLLDFDISLAQGHLFAPPRPVRADVLSDEPSEPAPSASRPAPGRFVPPELRRPPAAPGLRDTKAAPAPETGGSKAAWRTLARRVTRTEP
jgi:cyclic-di-GMP phosphodiesterase TipF (flagellum assembly factor)